LFETSLLLCSRERLDRSFAKEAAESDLGSALVSHLPSTMKAAQRVGSGPLDETLTVSTDVPLPKNARSLPVDNVLVKIAYTSLNLFDFKVAEALVIGSLAFQGIPLLDFAGVVVESNAPVSKRKN
jgi:hypothetical protein